MYRAKVNDFECTKSSSLGSYVPTELKFGDDEKCVYVVKFKGSLPDSKIIYVFENGKVSRVPLSAYETKSTRKKITGAYSEASPLVAAIYEDSPKGTEIMLVTDGGRATVINSSLVAEKSTRTSQGYTVISLKKGQKVKDAFAVAASPYAAIAKKLKKTKIPTTGSIFDPTSEIKE